MSKERKAFKAWCPRQANPREREEYEWVWQAAWRASREQALGEAVSLLEQPGMLLTVERPAVVAAIEALRDKP